MKKLLAVLLVVFLITVVTIPAVKVEARSQSPCELWAWSHYHPGFAMGCMIEIMSDFGGSWSRADGDGLSG